MRINPYTGSIRLVDKKTRVVEVFGPELPGSRWPTDRKLLYARYGPALPESVGLCFKADGRVARFLVDKSRYGDELLAILGKYPEAPSRLARPYGLASWLVQE